MIEIFPDPTVVPEIVRNSREQYGKEPEPYPAPEVKEEILFIVRGNDKEAYIISSEEYSIRFRAPDIAGIHGRAWREVSKRLGEEFHPKRFRLRFAKDEVIPLEEESKPEAETEPVVP